MASVRFNAKYEGLGGRCELIRPERWLEGDAEEIQKELNLDLVFGYRRYQHLSKNISRMELNKIFAEVRSCFY
jgi:hypothetical protein